MAFKTIEWSITSFRMNAPDIVRIATFSTVSICFPLETIGKKSFLTIPSPESGNRERRDVSVA